MQTHYTYLQDKGDLFPVMPGSRVPEELLVKKAPPMPIQTEQHTNDIQPSRTITVRNVHTIRLGDLRKQV